jgi:phospholipid/cholesterol/gamma-HCH transport system substrate-binding protein
METRANYLFVGLFVLLLFIGSIGFAVWIAKLQFDTVYKRYAIYFDEASGLRTGNSVSYRGIQVGEVIEVEIDPDNLERVRVVIEIEADTPIRQDTEAQVAMQGITGGTFILLTGGTRGAPPLEAYPGQRYPVIAGRPSTIQNILQTLPEVLANTNELLKRAGDLLNDDNRGRVANALANVEQATADAGKAIEQMTSTLQSIENVAGKTYEGIEETRGEIQGLVQELQKTATAATGAAEQVEGMISENREAVQEFTGAGLFELTALLTEMRRLVTALNRVTTQLERDPARFLFGDQTKGYEGKDEAR